MRGTLTSVKSVESVILLLLFSGFGFAAGPAGAPSEAMKRIHDKINALQAKCDEDAKAWQPRVELGELYLMFGYADRAAKRLDEALALKADDARVLQLAGEAHRQLKEPDKAIELWTKALELQPSDKRPEAWIAKVREQLKEDARLADLDARLKKNPSDPEALMARAQARTGREQWKEAVADLDALLAAKPNDPDAIDLSALAHYQIGDMDGAIRFWTRAGAVRPENVPLYKGWIERAQGIKKVQGSLVSVEEQLRASPADGKLHLQAGELHAKLGKWPKASQSFGEAVRLLPKDADAHRLYGIALFRVGLMDDAIREVETSVKLAPANADNARLLKSLREMRDMHRTMKQGGDSLPAHGMPRKGDSKE